MVFNKISISVLAFASALGVTGCMNSGGSGGSVQASSATDSSSHAEVTTNDSSSSDGSTGSNGSSGSSGGTTVETTAGITGPDDTGAADDGSGDNPTPIPTLPSTVGAGVIPSDPVLTQSVSTTIDKRVNSPDPGFDVPAEAYLKPLNLPQAWARRTDCSTTLVAVVDTGVNIKHADFYQMNGKTVVDSNIAVNANEVGDCVDPKNPRAACKKETNKRDDDPENVYGISVADDVSGANFVPGQAANDPLDKNGHGTFVAGIIGARGDNGVGVTGVCQKASILPIRVLDKNGTGTLSSVTEGIYYAAARGAKVLNLSLGGEDNGKDENSAGLYNLALKEFEDSGGLIVAAAGNEGHFVEKQNLLPVRFGFLTGRYDNQTIEPLEAFIVVAATDPFAATPLAAYSNRSNEGWVKIAAPGTGVSLGLSNSNYVSVRNSKGTLTKVLGYVANATGTSFSTPYVSGAAALVWSHLRANNPSANYTGADIKQILLQSAAHLPELNNLVEDNRFLDVSAALTCAESGGC